MHGGPGGRSVRRITLIDGLDEIPWARLATSNGNAVAFPALLRELDHCDGERGNAIVSLLFDSLYHQYSLAEAGAFVAPFLVALTHRDTPWRTGVMRLLGTLCGDNGEIAALARYDLESAVAWTDGDLGWAETLRRSHAAVAASRDHWRSLLGAADDAVRSHAAWLLRFCPGPDLVAEVSARLAVEPSRSTRACLLLLLGVCAAPTVTFERAFAEDPDAWPRAAAALCLARDGRATPASEALLDELEAKRFGDGDTDAEADVALAEIDRAFPFTNTGFEQLVRTTRQVIAETG